MKVKLAATSKGEGDLEGLTMEQQAIYIARVSSSREDKTQSPEKLINYLIKNKHWSPFEHGTMCMEVVTSKPIAIQFLRHVSFRFQELSQRYAKVSKIENIDFRLEHKVNRQSSTDSVGMIVQSSEGNLEFYTNLEADNDIHTWLADVEENMSKTLKLYSEGLELGIAKETARMILPMATQTTLYITGTLRSWIHMLDIRDEGHAQLEIQDIAKEMKRIFIEQCPTIANARGWVKKENTLLPYQERVIKEQKDLQANIGKLSSFLNSDSTDKLSKEEELDLEQQLAAMQPFNDALLNRISKFNLE